MKNKKIFYGILSIFVLVFGILYWLGIIGFWVDNIKGYFKERSDARYYQEIKEKSENLKNLYKEDNYGGTTPEETWALFVDALKKGDTDLASKYFVVEKQEQMRTEWKIAKEKGFIPTFLSDFSLIIGSRYYKNKEFFEFFTNEINGKPGFVYTLVLNKETNKWKILDL